MYLAAVNVKCSNAELNLHTETSCIVSVLGGRYTMGFTTQVQAGYCHAGSHKIVFTLGTLKTRNTYSRIHYHIVQQ